MHALTIFHRILSTSLPQIHAKRLTSLLAAVEAIVLGSRLTLSDMGRGLSGPVAVKHNIKRIDRLLGNSALHSEVPKLYEVLVRQSLEGITTPLIVIDWSDLTANRHWQLLRVSVAIEGRSMTLYEQVHPQSRATSPRVHKAFLAKLSTMLPTGCTPILITDAGFRSTWFSLVNHMGWSWIGHIRNRDMISPENNDTWVGCKTLYPLASSQAKSLGQYNYVRQHPVSCRLVLIKHAQQKRHHKSRLGKRVRSSRSLKNASAQREPCLLVASLALFELRLIGEVGKARQMEFKFQSNTRRSHPVLSVINLALQLVQHGMAAFPPREFNAVLERLRYDYPALQL